MSWKYYELTRFELTVGELHMDTVLGKFVVEDSLSYDAVAEPFRFEEHPIKPFGLSRREPSDLELTDSKFLGGSSSGCGGFSRQHFLDSRFYATTISI